MKIFDLEYYLFRLVRYSRYRVRKRKRQRGYLLPPQLLKKILWLGVLLLASLLLITYLSTVGELPPEVVVELPPPVVAEQKVIKPRRIPDAAAAPVGTAKAVALYDTTSGSWLLERNIDQLLPPASITKLLTAIVALENYQLSDPVRVPSKCVGLEGNQIGLLTEEVWTVEELMYGMLVSSASDATCALASHVAQVTDYVAAMNLRARSLGLSNTTFINPIGLDDEGHLSTARDIILLGDYVLKDEALRRIVVTDQIEIKGRLLENTNELLGQVKGLIGVKTGYTEGANECLLFAVNREQHLVLGVVLGSEDRFKEASALIEWVFATHEWVIE